MHLTRGAIGEVLPELAGRLEGSAIRVPTPNVSAVDLTFLAGKPVTVQDVNAIIREAAAAHMGVVMAYDPEPKVSIDFNHTAQSCIFAPDQTRVAGGRMVRVLAWGLFRPHGRCGGCDGKAGKLAGGAVADRMYLVVAGVIAAAIAADLVLNGSAASVFLVRKLFRLVEYLEFWR